MTCDADAGNLYLPRSEPDDDSAAPSRAGDHRSLRQVHRGAGRYRPVRVGGGRHRHDDKPHRGARADRGQHRRAAEARHGCAGVPLPIWAAFACSARTIGAKRTRRGRMWSCAAALWARRIISPTRWWSSRCSRPRRWTPTGGPKLDFYKSLPTVRHIALVYQDQMRVEHYRREERGFELDVLKHPEEVLHLRGGRISASTWRASISVSRCR